MILSSSSTLTLAPFGSFSLKASLTKAALTSSITRFFTISLSPSFWATTPWGSGFGKTVSFTFAVSVNFPLSYDTGTSISFSPASFVIVSRFLGSFISAFSSLGLTAFFTSSAVNFSPSTTTFFSVVELTTLTLTSTSACATTLFDESLYSTVICIGFFSPLLSIGGIA